MITLAASSRPSAYSSCAPTWFSKRESVGCEASGLAVHGVTLEQELVDRIVREPVGVIRIGMATGETEDALRQQILERVRTIRADDPRPDNGRKPSINS